MPTFLSRVESDLKEIEANFTRWTHDEEKLWLEKLKNAFTTAKYTGNNDNLYQVYKDAFAVVGKYHIYGQPFKKTLSKTLDDVKNGSLTFSNADSENTTSKNGCSYYFWISCAAIVSVGGVIYKNYKPIVSIFSTIRDVWNGKIGFSTAQEYISGNLSSIETSDSHSISPSYLLFLVLITTLYLFSELINNSTIQDNNDVTSFKINRRNLFKTPVEKGNNEVVEIRDDEKIDSKLA